MKYARIDDFQQVEVFFLGIPEIPHEHGDMVVVIFAFGEPILPPGGSGPEMVELVVFEKFRAGRDGIFHQEIAPIRTRDPRGDGALRLDGERSGLDP